MQAGDLRGNLRAGMQATMFMNDFGTFMWLVLIFVITPYGWVLNIIALVGADAVSGLEIARAVGIIVFPLGTFLGLFC